MNERFYYYIQDTKKRYDGNDVPWLNRGETTYDLREASVFTEKEAVMLCEQILHYKMWPVHKVNRLIAFHVSINKIINMKPKQDEKCLLLCTRDTVGKNACFWRWDHRGYACDVRAAQIFVYSEDNPITSREIDVPIPLSKIHKHVEHRIDMQDLNTDEDRMIHHTLEKPFFKGEKE